MYWHLPYQALTRGPGAGASGAWSRCIGVVAPPGGCRAGPAGGGGTRVPVVEARAARTEEAALRLGLDRRPGRDPPGRGAHEPGRPRGRAARAAARPRPLQRRAVRRVRAGLIDGWSRTGTRPEFDVVTGTSTGAHRPVRVPRPRLRHRASKLYTKVQTRTSTGSARGSRSRSASPWPPRPAPRQLIQTQITRS